MTARTSAPRDSAVRGFGVVATLGIATSGSATWRTLAPNQQGVSRLVQRKPWIPLLRTMTKSGPQSDKRPTGLIMNHESCPHTHTWKHTCTKLNTHYQIPSTGVIVCKLWIIEPLWDASLPWCWSCFVWIYFSLFPFILLFVSLLPGAINQGSCYALSSDSSASLLYLFTFWWGSHTSVCWRGILISCNFPAPTCTGVKCGKQQENTDVDSIVWQMKNGCEFDTRVCCILCCIFPIKSQVPYISGGEVVPTEEYLVFILWLELESKSMVWATIEQSNDREMEGRETYLGFEVSFDLGLWSFGFCNFTVHYFSNHLLSLCLKVSSLHYSTLRLHSS